MIWSTVILQLLPLCLLLLLPWQLPCDVAITQSTTKIAWLWQGWLESLQKLISLLHWFESVLSPPDPCVNLSNVLVPQLVWTTYWYGPSLWCGSMWTQDAALISQLIEWLLKHFVDGTINSLPRFRLASPLKSCCIQTSLWLSWYCFCDVVQKLHCA